MQVSLLAQAPWLNARRAIVYPRIFLAVYLVAIVVTLAMSPRLIDPFGKPIGTDFMNVWAAGKLALQGNAGGAYDYARHFEVERAALPWATGEGIPYFGWHYPPMFLVVAAGLALLPYGIALALWMIATLPAYLMVVRAILPGRHAMIAALAFPGVFINLGHGQNGFLTAGLFGGGLLSLERRPAVAGILFGLLSYKPQLGVIVPLALLVGGHWRALIVAAITVVTTAAISWGMLGSQTWFAFFNSLAQTREFILEQGATGWPKIQSTFAAVRLFGGGVSAAYAAQAVVAASATVAVVWTWRQPVDLGLKGAALVIAAVMITPYVLDYDLMVLALPLAWLTAAGLRNGFLSWEKTVLAALWLLPLVSRMIGQYLHLPLSPLMLGLLFMLVLRRVALAERSRGRHPAEFAVE